MNKIRADRMQMDVYATCTPHAHKQGKVDEKSARTAKDA